jgi:light-regulated signal transduction histidine kinase (bacteriophytochrome)
MNGYAYGYETMALGSPQKTTNASSLSLSAYTASMRIWGTGIGLAIVRKSMERMRGHVGVESALEQGSSFWVELPKYAEG